MRTRQGGKQWQDSSSQQEMFIKNKIKKDSSSKQTCFRIRILGINANLSGYFRNCKLKKPMIERQICVKNLHF